MSKSYPILEFDPDRIAIVNPQPTKLTGPAPIRGVLCFFWEVLEKLAAEGSLVKIGQLRSEIGFNPLYLLDFQSEKILVMHPGVGAPLSAAFLEECIQMGTRKYIVCGGCGVLDGDIQAGHPVVLTGAVRDEGTSYHYLPPGRVVEASPEAIAAIENTLQLQGVEYLKGLTWTTDGIFRETAAKREQRLQEGCLVVEMEAAALFAVAAYRNVVLGQVVYGGDLVMPEKWDRRGWDKRFDDRTNLFWLAVEACCRI